MKICSYLRLSRHNVYVYRRRIPENIQEFFATREIRQSLYTSDYKLAKSLARILTAEIEKHFLNLNMTKNTEPKFTTLIDLVTHKKEAMKHQEIIDEQRDKDIDLHIQKIHDARAKKLEELLKTKKRLLGEQMINEELRDEALDLRIQNIRDAKAAALQHERELNIALGRPIAPETKPAKALKSIPNLSKMIEVFLCANEVETRNDKVATVRKDSDALKLFLAIVVDKPISQVNQSDAALFANIIPMYPTRTTKRAPNTINNHMGSVSKFSAWVAAKHSETGHVKLEFAVLRCKQKERADEQRKMFEQHEIEAIFLHPKMAEFRNTQPAKYWLLHIALYSGARLEEIAQLDPKEDIREDESGIWIFDINEKNGKSLKNKSAKRIFPIHSELLALGLLQYVEQVKSRTARRLFPETVIRDGRTGKNIGKQANYFIQTTVGIKGKSMHCFRHTISTRFKRAMVDESLAAAIVGHAYGGITYNRYGKNYSSEVLQEVLQKIDFQLPHLTTLKS